MADDSLEIKVELDNSQSKAQLKAEADAFREVGKVADQTYKQATKAAGDSAAKRDAFGRFVAKGQKDSLGEVNEAFKANAEQGVAGMGQIAAAATPLIQRFAEIAGAAKGIGVAVSLYKGLTGAMNDAVEYGKKSADQLLALKNMVRDIASMTGSAGGSSDAFVQSFLDVRKASGLDNAGAKGFIQGFAGSGEAKKGINISPEEYEKAKPLLARFAAANSAGDAGAAESFGNLSGLLLGYRKGQTAPGAVQDITNFNDILKAGVGDNPTLIREAAQQAGAVLNSEGTGIVRDPNQLAALISTASIQRSPGQAGTVVQQANRVLRGFTGEHKGLLSDAGITAQDDMLGALYKLFDKIKGAEAKGIAPDQFLAQGGVSAIEDRNAITALYSGKDYLGRFLDQAAKPKSAEQSLAEVNATFRADSALQANVGQAKVDEAELRNAMLQQHVKPLELEARTRLTAQGAGMDSPEAMAQDQMTGLFASYGGLTLPEGMTKGQLGRRIREEQEMAKILKEKGMSVPNRPDDTSPLGGWSSDYLSWVTSGAYQSDYAAATNTQYLGRQVGGPPQAGRALGPGMGPMSPVDAALSSNPVISLLTNIRDRLTPPPVSTVKPGGANAGPVR